MNSYGVFNISSSESRKSFSYSINVLSAPRSSTEQRTRNEEIWMRYGVLLQELSEKRLQERGSLVTSDCRAWDLLSHHKHSNTTDLLQWVEEGFHVSFFSSSLCWPQLWKAQWKAQGSTYSTYCRCKAL